MAHRGGFLLISAGAVVLALVAGCNRKAQLSGAGASSDQSPAIADEALAPYQRQLIELAFSAASELPTRPHVKNRCKAQEAVATACIELDQPATALRYADQIDNWRRGACYADLAIYCIERGHAERARQYLSAASEVAESAEDWRRDRIRTRIAQAYVSMRQDAKARQYAAGVGPAETGKVSQTAASLCDGGSFDAQAAALDKLVATGNMDIVSNALGAYARLFDCFYDDSPRRDAIERKIRSGWVHLPLTLRMDLLAELARSAADHGDLPRAGELVAEGWDILNATRWRLETRAQLAARLAELRFAAGDEAQARTDVAGTLELLETQRARIANIYRAGALRPLAECYATMGDRAAALNVYAQAVEAGVENPNSRPRAEDLSATCLSMAVHRVEPDAALWARLRQIREGLGQPW